MKNMIEEKVVTNFAENETIMSEETNGDGNPHGIMIGDNICVI